MKINVIKLYEYKIVLKIVIIKIIEIGQMATILKQKHYYFD